MKSIRLRPQRVIPTRDIKAEQTAKRRDRIEIMMVVATISSSLATIAAVVVGIYQYTVARDQLVAADRNRSIQTMTEQVRALCEMLEETKIPLSVVRVEPYSDLSVTTTAEVERIIAMVSNDLRLAPLEGKLYYNADQVLARKVSDEFRANYAKAYATLRGSAQTVRLWIRDDELPALNELDIGAFTYLAPDVSLPLAIQVTTPENTRLVELYRFVKGQHVWELCPGLEAIIVNWSKGKGLALPKQVMIPVVTEDEAKQQIKDTGKLDTRSTVNKLLRGM